MKTTIYYFTGTGNSLSVAKELSSRIPDSDLIPLAGMKDFNCPSEKVGFVFPLYYWGLPGLVADAVSKMDFSKAGYIFYVVTSDDMKSPQFIKGFFDNVLKAYGKKINSGFRIMMPANYIKLYDGIPENEAKDQIGNSLMEIDRISETIIGGTDIVVDEKLPLIGKIVNSLWKKNSWKTYKKYFADDRCGSCELCKKTCPVDNIEMREGKPSWNIRCQECMACIQFCPNESIQIGEKTAVRKRYHHPDISVNDIIDQKQYK